MSVSLIIVDYHSLQKTFSYIRTCGEMILDVEKLHVIIVDNAEFGEKEKAFVEFYTNNKLNKIHLTGIHNTIFEGVFENQKFLYVVANENLGYAKGNNLGSKVSEAYYQDHYYLFSNNDMRIEKKFALTQLMEPIIYDKQIAVVGPHIVGLDGKPQTPWKESNLWKDLFLYYYDLILPKGLKFSKYITAIDISDHSKKCYWVLGSFILVDAEKFKLAGGFDTHTFLYGEEMILAERMKKNGFSMYYLNDITLIHEHGQTVQSAMKALKSIQYSFSSTMYYYEKYKKISKVILVLSRINFAFFSILFSCKKTLKSTFELLFNKL